MNKADVLIEALPYIRTFFGKTIVIKYGGRAMADESLKTSFSKDCVLLRYVGMKPVIVHGGGQQITRIMERMGKKVQFIEGQRITDKDTMEIVEMVLGGKVSKEIVSLINQQGGKAVGLSGLDGKLIQAESEKDYIGRVKKINPEIIHTLDEKGFIPVISPIAIGDEGERFNINADLSASELAIGLSAYRLVILTNTKGILKDAEVISTLRVSEIEGLIKDGVIKEGMIPKVKAAKKAVEEGVEKAHIIDGRVRHSILLELF
ncbi:MAG: acetylglutamate kinase, partial [bacterium]|nr:acetylglutamate kinase [bacterium]